MQSKFTSAVLAATLALTFAASGRAGTIIYSNIEPGDTFGPGVAIGVIPFVGIYNYAGVGFTAGQDYTFESLEMAVSLSTGPNVLDVYLMSSLAGLPNQVLESFTLDDMSTDPATGMVTIDSTTNPELIAGQQYWIVAAGGPTTTAFWAQNVHDVTGPNVSGPTLTSLQRDPNSNDVMAMQVEGALVGTPEPGSWALTAGALLLGLAYSYRSATRGSTRAALRAGK
jgi:hypothetical protein